MKNWKNSPGDHIWGNIKCVNRLLSISLPALVVNDLHCLNCAGEAL
jgi:hypothetical protein